jgi:hypothetical protein
MIHNNQGPSREGWGLGLNDEASYACADVTPPYYRSYSVLSLLDVVVLPVHTARANNAPASISNVLSNKSTAFQQ